MFLSQHITSNHSLSFFFISKEILAIARARGQRFPFCCSHCHCLLGFSSSRALKFLTGWGFFPYLQLSTWDSIFFFFILPFKSPANKTPGSGTVWAPIHLLNPVSLAKFCSTRSNTRSYFKSTANYYRKMTLQP